MPRSCSICGHVQRPALEAAIIAGTPYRAIAATYEVSKSAVERHAADHLVSAIARAAELNEKISADMLIAELRVLRETTLGVLEEARAVENHSVALKAIARLEKQAELVGRLAGELVDRQRIETVSVLFTEQWLKLRPAITRALLPYPEAAIALAEALADVDA